jgi:hypothetical protein
VSRLDEVKKRARLVRPVKAEILNQIDFHLTDALVNNYLVQDDVKRIRKLISDLVNKGIKLNVIDYKIKKGRDGKKLVLYCPFDIEVVVTKFMFERIVKEWGE